MAVVAGGAKLTELADPYNEGDIVEVLDEDKVWRAAILLSIAPQVGEEPNCVTKLLSSEKLLQLRSDSQVRKLKEIHSLSKQDFPVGARCKARYSLDGVWYDAVIEEHTPKGCIVEYLGYKNKEQVPLQHLKLSSAPNPSNSEKNAEGSSEGDDKFEIPQHLVILLDDSDAVKEKKRKRIRRLKKEYTRAKVDAKHVERQLGWKSFQAKASKKRVRGTFTNLKKESMFKVPENPDAKVGVIGGGQGMTEITQRELELSPVNGLFIVFNPTLSN